MNDCLRKDWYMRCNWY